MQALSKGENPLSLEFYLFVKRHLNDISIYTSDMDFEKTNALKGILYFSAGQVQLNDPQKAIEVLNILRLIQELGPRAYQISKNLQTICLKEASTLGDWVDYPPHIIDFVVPQLLKLRREVHGKKYCLDSFMHWPRLKKSQIPFFTLLIDEGANPNGEEWRPSPMDEGPSQKME